MTSERTAAESDAAAVADDSGIRLAADITDVVDVYFGEHRIWSVNPLRYSRVDDATRPLPWPRALKQLLRGRTQVRICRHLTGEVLLSREVAFEGSSESLELVDADGNWLTVTKWGFLAPAFAEINTDDRQALVNTVARLLDTLNAGTPLPAFAAYGTLLGAVRSGTLLGHDHDADIAYLSDADNPADLVRHSFAVQRFLRRQGWTVTRSPNGFLAAQVDLPSGRHAHVDIFSAHFAHDRFYLERWVGGALKRHHLLPLGHVLLEGTTLAAPSQPEALLACTYGDGWRIPDPSFKYKRPRELAEHLDRWVGGAGERMRWSRYHRAQTQPPNRYRPDFADWVLASLPEGAAVVDLGCATGHDALRYAASGHGVLGVDYSASAIATARELAGDMAPAVSFEALSLVDLRRLLLHGTRCALEHPGPRAVTGRLILDALAPDVRRHVWWLCRAVLLGTSGSTFLEVRAGKGVPSGHRQGAPWTTLVDPERIVDEVTAHGGQVEESFGVPAEDGSHVGTFRLRVTWPGARQAQSSGASTGGREPRATTIASPVTISTRPT